MRKLMLFLFILVAAFLEARHFAGDTRVYANLSIAALNSLQELSDRTIGTAELKAKTLRDRVEDAAWNATSAGTVQMQRMNQSVLDASITAAVKMELVNDELVPASRVHVVTSNGIVILTGTLAQPAQAGRAEALAWQAKGVSGVISRIRTSIPAESEGGNKS